MTTGSTRPGWLSGLHALALRGWPSLLLAIGISLLTLLALPQIHFEFSLEDLFPRDTPSAAAHRRAIERYGRDDGRILVALEGSPFDPRLAELEARAGALPGVVSTASPASWELLDPSGGGLSTRALAPGDRDPLSADSLVASNGAAGAVLLELDSALNHHAGREPIVAAIEALTQDIPGRWHLGGVPVIRVAYVRAMQRDLLRLLPLAMLVSLAFFIDALRDWRHVLLCAGVLILGTAATGSMLVLTATPFTIFTPAMLAVVLVVGTSDLVHLIHRFADRFQDGAPSTEAALLDTLRELAPVCLATSATTAVGFLSLMATAIPQIRRFGAMTALGVMLVFACSMILLPPALLRLGPPKRRATVRASRSRAWMARLGEALLARPLLAPALTVALLVFGISGALRVETDPHILGDVRSTEMARSNDFFEEHLGAVLPLDVHVTVPQGRLLEPEAIAALQRMEAWLREEPQVGAVIGLPDLLVQGWAALGEQGLPGDAAAASQVLLLFDMIDPGIASSLTIDEQTTRIRTRVRDHGHRATVDLVERLRSFAEPQLEPLGARLEITGVAWLAQEINATLTRQFTGSFALALAVVGALGLLVYRRVGLVLLALIPNTLPLLALLGLMGWTGLGLQPSTAMVFSVALGVAVDDTIHFLAGYRRRRSLGLDRSRAVVETIATVGRTLVDTSLLLAGGFVVFSVSQYGAMALFGQLTAFCVVVAAVSDLLILGPILALGGKKTPDPEKSRPSS
jgi:predicted RND superfamily exporter protein